MPVVNGIEQEYQGKLQVVRLNFSDRRNADAVSALGVIGHPTIVLLDGRGDVFVTRLGQQTEEQLEADVDALLAAPQPAQ